MAVSGGLVVLDQLAKLWAMRVLRPWPSGRMEVVRGLLDLTYAENTGAAWSLLEGAPDWVRRPLLVTISALASVLMIWMYVKTPAGQRLRSAALAVLLGGAVGNLIDRALRGYVVDFVRAHWYDKLSYPIFNVADVAISLGIAGLFLEILLGARRTEAAAPAPEASPTGGPPEGTGGQDSPAGRDAPPPGAASSALQAPALGAAPDPSSPAR